MPSAGAGLIASPPVPNTSVTESTTSATKRPTVGGGVGSWGMIFGLGATSMMIHLLRRDESARVEREANPEIDDGHDLAAERRRRLARRSARAAAR